MNYQWHHDRLIETRKNRVIEDDVYYERHHIVMRSMGGTDDEANLVLLTAREHFLSHWLLWMIHKIDVNSNPRDKQRVALAFHAMCTWNKSNTKRKITSSRMFAEAREAYKIVGGSIKGKKLKPMSEENKKKRSDKARGKTKSDVTKINMSISKTLYWEKLTSQARKECRKFINTSISSENRSNAVKKVHELRTVEHKLAIKSKQSEARILYWKNKKKIHI